MRGGAAVAKNPTTLKAAQLEISRLRRQVSKLEDELSAKRLGSIARKSTTHRTKPATERKKDLATAKIFMAAREYRADKARYPRSSADERCDRVRQVINVSRRTLDGYLAILRRCSLLDEKYLSSEQIEDAIKRLTDTAIP